MTLIITHHPELAVDIRNVRDWYDANGDPNTGDRFVAAVDTVLDRVELFPAKHPRYRHSIHSARMFDFSYRIYFHHDARELFFLAVVHTSRDPRTIDDILARREAHG